MSAAGKYDAEFRVRAVRMYREKFAEGTESKLGARKHVGALLDVNPATLRNWIEEAERTGGGRPAAARSSESGLSWLIGRSSRWWQVADLQ